MKNALILTGAMLASTLSSQAAVVYTSGFDTTYTGSSDAVVFDNGTTTAVQQWFGSTQGVTFGPTVLTIDYPNDNRYRGAGVWLSTAGWATGLVTVEFDVTGYTAGTDGAATIFQAYAANGVDASNTVSLDLHSGPNPDPTGFTGTATIAALGSQQTITANGTDVAFTFNYNGTDQFIALVFANNSPDVSPNANIGAAATLDNLTVTTVPEPSAVALLGFGAAGLMLRRRR